MKLADGTYTLTNLSDPPGERQIRVSGGGLIVEDIATGRIIPWNEEQKRYVSPDLYLTLTCASPDWFCWWEPGIVDIGRIA